MARRQPMMLLLLVLLLIQRMMPSISSPTSIPTMTKLILDQRVNLRLQSIHHLHQFVHFYFFLLDQSFRVHFFLVQCFRLSFPSNFFSLEGEFETLPLDVFGFETFLEIVMDGIEFDEASGLMFGEAHVFLEFFDFFGDESFVEGRVLVVAVGVVVGVVGGSVVNVGRAGLAIVIFVRLGNEGGHGSSRSGISIVVGNSLMMLLVVVAVVVAWGYLILGLLLG
mmetsp:Transcript_41448/g.72843  ORF Transcript_41448/g.72843 Transcript_41448/m.72843 type:complete len:223 (-) Transcript_41448:174-842(-)